MYTYIFLIPLCGLADELGLIYIAICSQKYPQRCAHMCLEELQRQVGMSDREGNAIFFLFSIKSNALGTE